MVSCFRKLEVTTLSALVGLVLGAGAVQAAPQSLALVATERAVELTCEGGACGAEFSTFCLQMDRFSPRPGTPYRLAGGEIRLVGIAEGGRRVGLDARRYLKFDSLRTHLALRISITRQQIDRLGLERVAVTVGENATLVPDEIAVDADADLAMLARGLRPLGSLIVDENRQRMAAARITNRLINALPATGRGDADAGATPWRRAAGEAENAGAAPEAVVMARKSLAFCRFAESRAILGGLRRCLQAEHDKFLDFLNSAYWKAVRTGS